MSTLAYEDVTRSIEHAHLVQAARAERAPVRFSDLRAMALSPAHYKYRLENRDTIRKRATSVGAAAHAMILGYQSIAVYPGKVRNGKAWEEFRAAHDDSIILLESEYAAAEGVARAVESCRAAIELLEGRRETELAPWTIAGRKCGGRPDVVHTERVVELKTSATSEPERFVRHAMRLGYQAQIAWYLDGNREGGGTADRGFIIAVEQTPPHVVTPLELTPRALEMGRRMYRLWFERLLVCEDTDQWPGYVAGVAHFDVPEAEDLDMFLSEEG